MLSKKFVEKIRRKNSPKKLLCKTNSVQWELGSYPNSSVPWLLGSHCDNPVADDRDLLKRNVTNFTPH